MKNLYLLFVGLILFICCVYGQQPGTYDVTLSDCGGIDDHWKFSLLKAQPQHPEPGEEVTLSVKGKLDETVTGGTVQTIVTYGFYPIINEIDDLCGDEGDEDNVCPIMSGSYSFQQTFDFPDDLPHNARLNVRVEAADQNEERIFCINLQIDTPP